MLQGETLQHMDGVSTHVSLTFLENCPPFQPIDEVCSIFYSVRQDKSATEEMQLGKAVEESGIHKTGHVARNSAKNAVSD